MDTDEKKQPTQLRLRCADRLSSLRTEHDVTLQQVASAVKLHRVYIGLVERGLVNLGIDNLSKLLGYYDETFIAHPVRQRLAENVKKARGSLSQEKFAEAHRVPVLFISKLERGAANTTLDRISDLAHRLGISGEELIGLC